MREGLSLGRFSACFSDAFEVTTEFDREAHWICNAEKISKETTEMDRLEIKLNLLRANRGNPHPF